MNPAVHGESAAPFSFRQLRLFAAIGDLKSVRRASEECSLSQPAVTQALAKLEEQLGATIVDRRASGSYLNPLGEVFHVRVRRFFDQMEEAVADAGGTTAGNARAIVNRLTRSQVRALIGAIDHGSFDRAALALAISPSSLQRAARDLESNLHAALFYRTAAGLLVTPTGTRFGRRVKLALQEIELGIGEMEAARGGSRRRIVIGAMPFGGSLLLASALNEFLARQPEADIHIINDSAPATARALCDGEVDLVIGLLPETLLEEIVGAPLAPTPYSIVVRRGHPLTRKGRISLADLAACDWVIGTQGSSRRACFDRLFPAGSEPRAHIATCALTVTQELLRRSDRLTLMTSYELSHAGDDLRSLAYQAIMPVPMLGIMTRAGWMATQTHAEFIAIVRDQVAALTPMLRRVS